MSWGYIGMVIDGKVAARKGETRKRTARQGNTNNKGGGSIEGME